MIYFEHLLNAFCDRCLSENWDKRTGLHKAISLMIEKLGTSWGKRYETNLMNIALFSLKNIPKEASIASARSFEFLINICGCLYGKVSLPKDDSIGHGTFLYDALSPLKKKETPELSEEGDEESTSTLSSPNDEVMQIVIPELASTFNLSRYVIAIADDDPSVFMDYLFGELTLSITPHPFFNTGPELVLFFPNTSSMQ